jgi:hypothetical protein
MASEGMRTMAPAHKIVALNICGHVDAFFVS